VSAVGMPFFTLCCHIFVVLQEISYDMYFTFIRTIFGIICR